MMTEIERTIVDWFEAHGAIVTHDREAEWILHVDEGDYSLTALATAIAAAQQTDHRR
jgi:hypothetical protein